MKSYTLLNIALKTDLKCEFEKDSLKVKSKLVFGKSKPRKT